MVNFPGYTIGALLCDTGDFSIFLASKNLGHDSTLVLLKIPASQPTPAAVVRRLEHEFEIARELDPHLVIRPLALEWQEGDVALVLENSFSEPLADKLNTPMDIGHFLRIAMSIVTVLAEIHRHGLIHKDIKPQHLLLKTGTDQVRITGFGIASHVPREPQAVQNLNFLEGTLPYMSPEQTGRMNRSLDYRSDFYSLGITLYQMITGQLPFQATDPLEWVYCHIARFPKAPATIRPLIPEPISEIIMKLLAKVAEDRYQSATSLQRDLEKCLSQWESTGHIERFTLGKNDISDRFQIPQKLYGREAETAQLLTAFDRVAKDGTSELILVSGYSGIGKSSLVQELYKPVLCRRGFFISGKFDQVKRDIPYSTIIFAFRQLIHQILSESEERIGNWKDQLMAALGANGQLIIDMIPEVESVIGKQPPTLELPLSQAQHRFHRVFQSFLSVFAKAEHPLTLFLDDLQWIDPASLQLLTYLITTPETRYLLLVGAYRDNEVSRTHPLILAIENIRQNGAPLRHIILGPLSKADMNRFTANTFHCDLTRAEPLAQVVHEKTGSNPFFAIQFLTALYQEHLIRFDNRNALWQWDLEQIQEHWYTDNIVDFMISKLARLPPATQRAMQFAACIGHEGSLSTLALICGQSEEETYHDLWYAACEGLILRLHDGYQFPHDRVQQAAYAQIPKLRRQKIHLKIARLLLEENIFELVNQLNLGAGLMVTKEEKRDAARLNLIAGNRAKASTAYKSALRYYKAGIALLGSNPWQEQAELAYPLHFGQAQCEYLLGRSDKALTHFDELLTQARTDQQKAEIYRINVEIYTLKTELSKAIDRGIEGLQLLGIEITPHPSREQVLAEYEEVWRNLGNREIEDLANLPLMEDAKMQAAMGILEALFTAALCTDENLFLSWASHMVNISIRNGNCDASVTGYAYLGLALGSLFSRYREGYLFGKLGHDLVEKQKLLAYRAKANFIFGDCINYWHRHLRNNMKDLEIAFQNAVEVADIPTACYCCNHIVINLLVLGEPLDSVHLEAERRLEFTQKANLDASIQAITAIDRVVQNMRGLTAHFSSFSNTHFNEKEYEQQMDTYSQPLVTCWYYIMKLQARFMSGDFEIAIAAAHKASPLLWSIMGHTQESEYWYYHPLSLTAIYHQLPPEQQGEALQTLKAHQNKLHEWAENCPQNFLNKYALVSAEIARITGMPLEETMSLYEQSIRSARENGFIQNEGIANELAAKFYQKQGFITIARAYLMNARNCYQRWGADGKVKQLEKRHPWLRTGHIPETIATITAPIEQLDMLTVVKAQQAISSEIIIDQLVETLLRIVLENAGAQKACLFMEPGGEVFVVSHTENESANLEFYRTSHALATGISHAVLNYVKHTRETVILADASKDTGEFASDEYLQQTKPKSILCMPVVRQAKLSGILYLENNLVANAFTPDLRTVLEMLASQAAISLETAELYSDLQQAKNEQQSQADILRLILNSMGEGVIVANDKGEVLLFNPMAEKIIGVNILPRLTEEWAAHYGFHKSDQKTLYRTEDLPLYRAIRGESTDNFEVFMQNPSAPEGRWLSLSARTLKSKDGVIRGGVTVYTDITARIQTAQSERNAKEMAEAANRAKDQFLAMLSHELRTPLTPVLNGINALEDDATDESRPILEIMRRNLILETRLIDDLLDITRVAKGKFSVQLKPVDAHRILKEALQTCHSQLEQREVALNLEAKEHIVNADPGRLHQIVCNLLQNAVRFTAPGNIIELHTFNPTPGVFCFQCRDNGVGIDAEDLSRIFEAFEQSKRTVQRGYGGLGLGLSISKALIEAHGGTIIASSEGRGKGATIEITLPCIPKEPLEEEATIEMPASRLPNHQKQPDTPSPQLSPADFRILLIEDHTDTRQTLQRLLSRAGYQVETANNAQSAREHARNATFDLFICDIGLPDGSGYDLIHDLHQLQSIPAISLSGFGMEADFEKSHAAGFAEHLVKPIDFKQLKEAIERLRLEHSQRRS